MSLPIAAKPGSRWSDWFVLGEGDPRKGQAVWRVQCVCGTLGEVPAADLRAGRTTRCSKETQAHAVVDMRRKARSVRCPVCNAIRDRPCSDMGQGSFDWGVHSKRAQLAGCASVDDVMAGRATLPRARRKAA